jgi:hypothetical protein
MFKRLGAWLSNAHDTIALFAFELLTNGGRKL